MSLQSREHELRSPRMFSKCASCSAAAILARQDHFAERGPPKFSLCERAQSSCGGGETHIREAPPPSPGVGAFLCSQRKALRRSGAQLVTFAGTMLSRLCGLVDGRSNLTTNISAGP
jgi:hypothetical protein